MSTNAEEIAKYRRNGMLVSEIADSMRLPISNVQYHLKHMSRRLQSVGGVSERDSIAEYPITQAPTKKQGVS